MTVSPAGLEAPSRKSKLLDQFKMRKGLFVMLLIGMTWYLIFQFYPMVKVYWAFTNIGQVPPSKVSFIGFANFIKLFKVAQFRRSLWNTFYISFLKILIGFPIPIIFSLLLNEMRISFLKRGIQTVIYVPHFLSWVVVGAIWYIMLAPINSPNAQVAALLGKRPVFWWAADRYIRGLLVATDIWRNAGYGTIIYLASIMSIDPTLYEAAIMDGANRWQQTWHITLAGLKSVIVILFILRVGKILNLFKQVFVLTTPIVRGPSDVLMTYAYRTGIQQMQIGYAMAVSLFKAVVGLSLVLITNWLAKKIKEEGVF
ncbi:MAG: sugar ABC transporter permease [Spirochaetes bacterium]|nr:MAG: sugar ABC transporter permease [Spirochaetota bacterium]